MPFSDRQFSAAQSGQPEAADLRAPLHQSPATSSTGSAQRAEQIVSRLMPALDRLLRAYDYAQDCRANLWDFALEIDELRGAELSTSDLHWLVRKGFAEHARETTLQEDETRTFRRTSSIKFSRRSCFVLTSAGASFLRDLLRAPRPAVTAPSVRSVGETQPAQQEPTATQTVMPHWDGDLLELRVDGVLVKQFKLPAPNQEVILAAFEEEGWPPRIDDPLPPAAQQDPKRRLHDTINSLNRNHKVAKIRFMGDGSGEGVRWATIE